MSAYVVVESNLLDAEKLSEYGALAMKTVSKYDGRFLFKGPTETLHGNSLLANRAVIEFSSEERAKAWYHSDEYQSLSTIREQAIESHFHLVVGV